MSNCECIVVVGAAGPMLHLDEDGAMPGGRRKSRKPQKWEDFVADEEQLACLEQELEQEEVARMQSVEDGQDSSDGEMNLEIVVEEEENKSIKKEEEEEEEDKAGVLGEKKDGVRKENGEGGKEAAMKGEEQPSTLPTTSAVGDCTTCGIQLRDWPSTYSHLRFHRLSHVPDCVSKLPAAVQTKRITCQVCQRNCQTREVLAYHAYTEHYVKLKEAKMCPFCCSSFTCLDDFLDHLDITNITFHCEMCGLTVSQEHKFYQHIVYCSKKHHLGLTSLACCVCGVVTKINRLYDHLTQHSTQLNLPRHLSSPNKVKRVVEPCIPKQQTRFRPFLCEMCNRQFVVYSEYRRHLHSHTKSRSYMCTHCGRSYCQKNTLIVHLYQYHNASPNAEEVTPRGEQTQRRCEACGCVGFTNEELLVRHCVMRCPKRNNLQASFAVIIASIAKNQNSSFVETLHSPAMVTYLKLGLEAWQTPACVRNYLESLQPAASHSPAMDLSTTNLTSITADLTTNNTNTSRKDSVEFTDIQLLAYLTQFEEKNRQDKEISMVVSRKGKSEKEQEEAKSLQMEEMEEEMEEGGGEESLLPFLCTTTTTLTSPPTSSYSPALTFPINTKPQINHTSLMQHLRRGAERRGGNYGQGEGQGERVNPVDICLVTSTTNTQVTITPAGHHLTQDIKPPKIANALPHKPSVAEIKAQYPGVTVLSDVDFTRIPFLLMEMRENMSDRIERAMEAAGFTMQDMQRLEVEAQLLREAEPFYLEDDPIKEEDGKAVSTCPPSPSTIQRLTAEMKEMFYSNGEENSQYTSPLSPASFHNKTKEENGHDVPQGSTNSHHHSPLRKKSKKDPEAPSPVPEKCNGDNAGNGPLASTSGAHESFPPKYLLECLLKEAQTLGES